LYNAAPAATILSTVHIHASLEVRLDSPVTILMQNSLNRVVLK
jgi:hypothetical protein